MACILTASTASSYVMSYYVRPAGFVFYGNPADHTYACVNGNCYSINNTSKSGGNNAGNYYLNYQAVVRSICAQGCYMQYAVDGVCHQHTNRMLYYVNQQISIGVGGYSLTRAMYGICGKNFQQCLTTCGS